MERQTERRRAEELADIYWQARMAHDDVNAQRAWDELGREIDRESREAAAGLPDFAARAVRAFAMRRTDAGWAGSWHHPAGDGYEWWHGVRGAGWAHDGDDADFPCVVTVHRDGWTMQYVEGDVYLSAPANVEVPS